MKVLLHMSTEKNRMTCQVIYRVVWRSLVVNKAFILLMCERHQQCKIECFDRPNDF